MAIDDDKKRPYTLPAYGQPAPTMPGVKPAALAPTSGATGFSARGAAKPVATGVNPSPAPAIQRPTLTANSAGQATAAGIGSALRVADQVRQQQVRGTAGLAAGLVDGATAPMRRAATGAVNFGRGMLGMEAQGFNPTPVQDALASVAPSVYGISRPAAAVARAAPAAAPAATPVPRPAPAAPAAPVVNPAGSAAGGGGSTPAGGIPTPPPAPVLRPGDPNTFTGGNGITRAVPMADGAAVAAPAMGAVDTQAFGGSAPVATAAPTLAMPRAPQAITPASQNVSRSGEVRDMRQAALSDIGSQLFQLRGQNTRSSRAAIGDLIGAQAGLVNNAATVDGSLAGGNRDAAVRAGSVGAEQQGANDRSALEAGTQLQRTQLEQAGALDRTRLDLQRPTLQTDAAGNLLSVTGDRAAAVTDAQGNPVRGGKDATLAPGDVLDAYTKQYEATLASVPIGQDATPYLQTFAASPIAQAYRAVLAGNPAGSGAPSGGPNQAPAVGTVKAGWRFKGGDPANPQSWEQVK